MIFDKKGKATGPTWFKMPAGEVLEWLDVLDDGDDSYISGLFMERVEEEEDFLQEMGKVFVNALVYFRTKEEPPLEMNRESKVIFRRIKNAIDKSYDNYCQAVENGKKNKPKE